MKKNVGTCDVLDIPGSYLMQTAFGGDFVAIKDYIETKQGQIYRTCQINLIHSCDDFLIGGSDLLIKFYRGLVDIRDNEGNSTGFYDLLIAFLVRDTRFLRFSS
ncbi:hypothetical protein RRG08_019531 [Elysia crispata]|uniref:Uncharacterized protein n=1 Tax=Elysia crispata TaxID=231223 RepID=A0AAE0YY30_9GAST|nr:hypothetical protein RRG08_019531 [Elysia crispata]